MDLENPFSWIIGVVVAIAVVVLGGFVMNWMGQPAQIAGVENVREQFADGYRNYQSMKAAASNVCSARKAVETAGTPEEQAQRNTQLVAQEQNYNRIAAQYNAAMQNVFAAKLVAPGDLPREAPTLPQALTAAGC